MAFTKRIKRYPKNRSSRRNRKSHSKKRYKGGAQAGKGANAGPGNGEANNSPLSFGSDGAEPYKGIGQALVNQRLEYGEEPLRLGLKRKNTIGGPYTVTKPMALPPPLGQKSPPKLPPPPPIPVGSLNVSQNGSPPPPILNPPPAPPILNSSRNGSQNDSPAPPILNPPPAPPILNPPPAPPILNPPPAPPILNSSLNSSQNDSQNPVLVDSQNPPQVGSLNSSRNGSLNSSRNGSLNSSRNGSRNGSPVGSVNPLLVGSLNSSQNDSQNPPLNPLRNPPNLPPRTKGSTARGVAATTSTPLSSVNVPTTDAVKVSSIKEPNSSETLNEFIKKFIEDIKDSNKNDDYVKEVVPKLYMIMENIKKRNPLFVLPDKSEYVISYVTLREKQLSIKKLLDNYVTRNKNKNKNRPRIRLVKADDPALFDLLKNVYTICTSKPTSRWPF